MEVKQFNEKQATLVINGLHVALNRNERVIENSDGTKYEYDVEEFDINNKEDIDKEVEAHMLFLLHEYDKSKAVNCFYLNGMSAWLDKETRIGLKLRFEAEKSANKTETILWMSGFALSILIDTGLQMLYQLEIYASACYDNTAQHEANIKALSSAEEKTGYDFTVGYPAKLNL